MKVDEEIDHTRRVVKLTVSGDLTDRDLLALRDRVEKIPGISQDFSMLIDVRPASGRKVSSKGVRTLAEKPLVLSPDARRAVVVPGMLGYGMARMYELFRGQGATRVFMDYDAARKWVETGEE